MAGRIPRHFITELLNRTDIVALIERHVTLKKTGSNHSACCPFHQEKTPSFSVSSVKQFYYCFGCHASGNAIGFLMAYQHLEFVDAVEELAAQCNMQVPYEQTSTAPGQTSDLYGILHKTAEYFQQQLRQSPQAIAYLKARGVTGIIAKHFALGYAPSEWDSLSRTLGINAEQKAALFAAGLLIEKAGGKYYDRFRHRIMFPIRDRRGRVIAFGGRIIEEGTPKYLNSPETPVFHKGGELYGLYEVRQAQQGDLRELLLVEGYMDVIALAQHGITHAVATLGTAVTRDHLQRLFRTAKRVICAFDGDQAGRQAAWRTLQQALPLLKAGLELRFLFLPEGDDPDSLVRRLGKDGFLEVLSKSNNLIDYLIQHLSEKHDRRNLTEQAEFIQQARLLIKQIPDEVLQSLMMQTFADHVGVDMAQFDKAQKVKATPPPAKATAKTPRRWTPMRRILALLVQQPSLASRLGDYAWLKDGSQPGSAWLYQLLEDLHQAPIAHTGALLEHYRDRAMVAKLQQLATLDLMIPEQGRESELLDAWGKLQQQYREQRVDYLLQQSRIQPLSITEKRELEGLLREGRMGVIS